MTDLAPFVLERGFAAGAKAQGRRSGTRSVAARRARAGSWAKPVAGFLLVVLSSVLYAVVPIAGRMLTDDDAPVLTTVFLQNAIAAIAALMLALALGVRLRIGYEALALSAVAGAAYAGMLFSYVASVRFIAADSAVIIYFLYPVLVGAIVLWSGREGMTGLGLAALVLAFAGLALGVGFSAEGFDLSGVLLALDAALCISAVIFANMHAMETEHSLIIAFYTMLSASVFTATAAALTGTLDLTAHSLGGVGFFGVALCSSAGALTFIVGQGLIGAARAAMISNLEPMAAVLLAWAVLGERLTGVQATGCGLVLLAIGLMEFAQVRAAKG